MASIILPDFLEMMRNVANSEPRFDDGIRVRLNNYDPEAERTVVDDVQLMQDYYDEIDRLDGGKFRASVYDPFRVVTSKYDIFRYPTCISGQNDVLMQHPVKTVHDIKPLKLPTQHPFPLDTEPFKPQWMKGLDISKISSVNSKGGAIKMPKAMISQPMNNLTNDQIEAIRKEAIAEVEGRGYEFVDTFFPEEWAKAHRCWDIGINAPVMFMGGGLQKMAECQAVYFCKGWSESRGCVIEFLVAKSYGLWTLFAPDAEKEDAIYDAEGKLKFLQS